MTLRDYAILRGMSIAQPLSSIDPAEVEKFSKMAAEWWNPRGKFGVLHVFNPVRLAYIKEQVTARFARDPFDARPFMGLRILDIGCGGGLLTEPMARLGADIVGVDPSERNIKTASVHAAEQEISIDYRVATAEDLAAAGETFDVILNMEVIEHVADPKAFTATCAGLLKPGGLMFVATLNRTLKSFGLAIIGAEYILGWLPKGTHQWEKFIAPGELEDWLAAAGLETCDRSGVVYNPLSNTWRRARDMDVNYMMLARKPSHSEKEDHL
ncbi:bifunctional 2-polyprenyl-6-hydroxyphenol methylase/3-demethylubiquinol 3-O-methyltransferase UbiG [soil metagenome]